MDFATTILLFIIIVGVLAIIYATIYNNLVEYKIKIEKSEGIIDEKLREKYDIIAKINTSIKKEVKKKDYLKKYIDLKNQRITNYELDRKLTEAFNLILEVKNDPSTKGTILSSILFKTSLSLFSALSHISSSG